MNFGIIGCGGIADRRTIPGMIESPDVTITAVQDISENTARSVAGKYGVKHFYTSVDDLLNQDDVEAVYIGTPVWAHEEQIRKTADSGRHILCEKPLALSVEQTEGVIEHCREKNVMLQVGFMMRYHGYHIKAKQMIDAGELGKPVMGRGQLTCWYPPMENAWRQDPARGGGGALMDMAIHTVDILRYLFGDVDSVSSFNGNETHGYAVEDSGVILLKFKSGAYGVCDSFFNIPDEAARGVLEIYGTKGSLMAEGTISQIAGGSMVAYVQGEDRGYDARQERSGIQPANVEAGLKNMYLAEVEDFIDAIRNRRQPMNSGQEALKNFLIIQAAYESQRSGRAVSV